MATKITGTNTAAAPGVTGDDTDTGLFYGTNEIGFSTGGTSRLTLDSSGFLNVPDGGKIRFGTGNDLEIFHDGSDSYIDDAGTGDLCLRSSTIYLQKYTGENCAKFVADGAVELYFDNTKRFETYASGTLTTGNLKNTGSVYVGNQVDGHDGNSTGQLFFGASNDLKIYHDGSHSYIKDAGTGNLQIVSNQTNIQDADLSHYQAKFIDGGAVELYHAGSKKIESTSTGLLIDSTNNGYGGLKFDEFSSGDYGCNYILGRDSGAAAHVFKRGGRTQNQSPWADATGSEIARISRGGISFGGDTAEVNTLQDYEEGTWTPVDASGGSVSFTDTAGNCKYTKIGRLVIASFTVTYLSTSNTAQARVGGLPYACVGTTNNNASVAIGETNDSQQTRMVVNQGQSYMLILHCHNAVVVLNNSEAAGHNYRGTAIYQTA